MRFSHPGQLEEDVGLNMTPMIDVVFLLIVFFLVAAQLSVGSEEDVELPYASEAKRAERMSPDTVTVDMKWVPGGAAFEISGVPYGRAELLRELASLVKIAELRGTTAPPVVLRADYRVPYREVQRIMFACADLGISVFDFQATREGGRTP